MNDPLIGWRSNHHPKASYAHSGFVYTPPKVFSPEMDARMHAIVRREAFALIGVPYPAPKGVWSGG